MKILNPLTLCISLAYCCHIFIMLWWHYASVLTHLLSSPVNNNLTLNIINNNNSRRYFSDLNIYIFYLILKCIFLVSLPTRYCKSAVLKERTLQECYLGNQSLDYPWAFKWCSMSISPCVDVALQFYHRWFCTGFRCGSVSFSVSLLACTFASQIFWFI